MEFSNKPNLYHVYHRVKKSERIDRIVIATSNEEKDELVFEFCIKENINCFRGSEDDVLDRFYQCSKQFGLIENDILVRITADCPLIDPGVIDEVIEYFEKNQYDYVSNVIEPTYPDGLDVEVFTFSALKKSWNNAVLNSEREHVTPYIIKNDVIFRIGSYKNKTDLSNFRWTLDEIEDYEFINTIYKSLYRPDAFFSTNDVLLFLKNNPKLNEINNKHARNDGYLKSLKKDMKWKEVI